MDAAPTEAQRQSWLKEAVPLLNAAAKELRTAATLEAPAGEEGTVDFQIAVLAEEVSDVYTRVHDLAERLKLDSES